MVSDSAPGSEEGGLFLRGPLAALRLLRLSDRFGLGQLAPADVVSLVAHLPSGLNEKIAVMSEELAWATGLFEGEGSISLRRGGGQYGQFALRAVLHMTTRDILEVFAERWGGRYPGRRAGYLEENARLAANGAASATPPWLLDSSDWPDE